LLGFFSGIVVSGEFGWLKPHPHIYLEPLRRVGSRPERTLFVGDDLHNDVKGPNALGMRTAWFVPGEHRSSDPDIDVHVTDLRKLPA
jgi:putative hydrolase of the HAD superfamily